MVCIKRKIEKFKKSSTGSLMLTQSLATPTGATVSPDVFKSSNTEKYIKQGRINSRDKRFYCLRDEATIYEQLFTGNDKLLNYS